MAYDLNSNRKLKSRIAYLRGQVLENLGQNDRARESYTAAYKYSNDFEFEVKSQIAIAKTFNGKEIIMVLNTIWKGSVKKELMAPEK